jgi:DNA polymerase III subunit delta
LAAVAEALKPVYLITGGDRPKIARALRRLRARIDPDAVETLSAADRSGEDVVAACNALGLFGNERLVIVEDVDGRRNADGRLVGGWKAADVKQVAEYVGQPAAGTVLVLVAEELKKDTALWKACARAGDVLAYDVTKRKLPEWVAEQFARLEAPVEPEACRALIGLVGDDLDELAAEIDKLATWSAGDTVTESAVHLLAAGRAETSIFAFTDAWGRRATAAVLSACESLLERGGRGELPRLIGLLANHVGRVRACQALAAEGLGAREAASRLKLHPFAAEKAFTQATAYSPEELRDVVVRLAQLDHAVKGGSRLSPELELERALVDATRPAARAGG